MTVKSQNHRRSLTFAGALLTSESNSAARQSEPLTSPAPPFRLRSATPGHVGHPSQEGQPTPPFGHPSQEGQPTPPFGHPSQEGQPTPPFGHPSQEGQPTPPFGHPSQEGIFSLRSLLIKFPSRGGARGGYLLSGFPSRIFVRQSSANPSMR